MRGLREEYAMSTPLTPITDFVETVAAGKRDRFEGAVRAAYEAGADLETLLMAVDLAACGAAPVPASLKAEAYRTVHQWAWIAARRGAGRRRPVLQGA